MRNIKHFLSYLITGVVMLAIGFVGGKKLEHAQSGYFFNVYDHKEYSSSIGPFEWSYVMESIGLPFLDPGTTIIKYGNRTIYKAQRDFQSDAPYARNIVTSGNSISWDDGDFQYHLTIETNFPAQKMPPPTPAQK